MAVPAISVKRLSFRYDPQGPCVLHEISLDVAAGERCLVVGANGAGKTTLLRLIAGRHMIDRNTVQVLGRAAFHDTSLAADVTFLGGRFPFTADVRVKEMVHDRTSDPARCETLTRILGVDPAWHMHRVSDGQRRRVQLMMGLLNPCKVLLLDEIMTDLDLLGRTDLLDFLYQESAAGRMTILYATHILDRLESWASHILLLVNGYLWLKVPLAGLPTLWQPGQDATPGTPLARLVEGWIRKPEKCAVFSGR